MFYFSDNFDIETVNVNVNYSFGDISSNYRLVKNMITSIYYPTQIFDYGIINTSISPIKNRDYGKFYVKFEPQTYIQTEKVFIDSSSGIIKLDNEEIGNLTVFEHPDDKKGGQVHIEIIEKFN